MRRRSLIRIRRWAPSHWSIFAEDICPAVRVECSKWVGSFVLFGATLPENLAGWSIRIYEFVQLIYSLHNSSLINVWNEENFVSQFYCLMTLTLKILWIESSNFILWTKILGFQGKLNFLKFFWLLGIQLCKFYSNLNFLRFLRIVFYFWILQILSDCVVRNYFYIYKDIF